MSTVARIQHALMVDLMSGELSPGTWVRQDELAERLGVSKIPVREALQRLAAIGLLRFEPNRGAVVPRLTADDALEIFALRRGVEPQLLARALPRLTIVDLAEAEVALAHSGPPVAGDLAASNWAFHRALYRASGWERGLYLAEILHVAVAPYVALYTDHLGGADESDVEHRALLTACRADDLATANAVLGAHLDHAERALLDYLDGYLLGGDSRAVS